MYRFRRDWFDLLTGVALVAFIAMIIVMLLSGGSLISLVRRGGPADVPLTNTTDTSGVSSTLTRAQPADNGTGSSSKAGGGNTEGVSPRPAAQRNSSVAETTERLPSAASAVGGFRVAAGALPSRDTASTLAQNYRDDGYKVVVEQQDDFYLLWVGPYATLADADRAAERIIADGGDALVYTYGKGDSDAEIVDAVDPATHELIAQPLALNSKTRDANGGGSKAATTTGNVGSGIIDVDASNAASVQIGQHYLQVGVFISDKSAQPLRTQLERLSLNVTSSEDASGLVRLYVGPLGGAQVTQIRTQLTVQGIDSFPAVP